MKSISYHVQTEGDTHWLVLVERKSFRRSVDSLAYTLWGKADSKGYATYQKIWDWVERNDKPIVKVPISADLAKTITGADKDSACPEAPAKPDTFDQEYEKALLGVVKPPTVEI